MLSALRTDAPAVAMPLHSMHHERHRVGITSTTTARTVRRVGATAVATAAAPCDAPRLRGEGDFGLRGVRRGLSAAAGSPAAASALRSVAVSDSRPPGVCASSTTPPPPSRLPLTLLPRLAVSGIMWTVAAQQQGSVRPASGSDSRGRNEPAGGEPTSFASVSSFPSHSSSSTVAYPCPRAGAAALTGGGWLPAFPIQLGAGKRVCVRSR